MEVNLALQRTKEELGKALEECQRLRELQESTQVKYHSITKHGVYTNPSIMQYGNISLIASYALFKGYKLDAKFLM